jgi:hypothetical protein
MSIKSVDSGFVLWRGERRWIEYFESEIALTQEDLDAFLVKAVQQGFKYNVDVWPTIMLMARRKQSDLRPTVLRPMGGCGCWMELRYVVAWEVPAGPLLEGESVDSLPLVAALKATPEEMKEAMDRLRGVQDRERRSELVAEFVTWSSLNYNRDEVRQIREILGMANTKDVLMASPIGEEILEYGKREGRNEGIAEGKREGIAEGRSEGIAEGKREGLRASVESLAEAKFPGALEPGFAQRLATFEALEAMFREMLGTDDPNRVSRTLARLAEAGR